MHYYQFNIGDYAKSTLHLSLLEDLAYRRLLDRYYDTEKPLEADITKLCRFIRMGSYETETQQVLDEFFSLTQKGWIQKRVAKELGQYSAKADSARANGKKGGRPKKTQSVNLANPDLTQPKAKQEPLTIKQEPIKELSSSTDDCPHSKIVDSYHSCLPQLRKVKVWNDKRKKNLRTRWREDAKHQSLEFWERLFNYVGRSDFLMGNKTDFQVDLEWIINPSNFVKIVEGKYHEQ
jgi:uncharacterized protein YdaU (DUF1376 family)